MSRVKRLSIRGIRNFDDTTEAHIKFERPLTLIVGQNGVGKTTIIECLRFIATGEFPPNSDRGKSFIHDPMLKKMKSIKIRGLVKAEFTDRKGERFIVTRAIESTRVDNSVKFRSLDNVICKINPKTKEVYLYFIFFFYDKLNKLTNLLFYYSGSSVESSLC